MTKLFTFVLTNHTDKKFIDDFYEAENFIKSTNAILLLRVNYFVSILNTFPSNYSFRLVIHEGLRNRGGYSRSEAIIAELESAYPNYKANKIVFLTREQDLFPNQELFIDDKVGRHINFNKCNVETIVNHLPIYSKFDFISGKQSNEITEESNINSGNTSGDLDFAILTALYEHEFAVYKSKCKLDSAHGVYNSYNALFKEKIQIAHGVDYQSNFLVVHQEQMGLVDAAIHSTQVISSHDPTFVIMSGVCGGRKGQVNQYDVIIPTTVYDYATGKFKEGKLESLEYEASLRKELTKFLIAHNDKIVHNMRSLIDEDRKDLLSKDFKIVIDEFACGPWVVKTEGFLNKMAGEELTKYSTDEENKMFLESIPVNKINEKIKGLEMESYSILRAGEVIQRPNHYSLVVKSVMDFTNEYKNDGQFKEIKSSASYISFLCVRAMMPLLLDFKKNIEKWKK